MTAQPLTQVPELGPDGSEVTLTGRPVELHTRLSLAGYPMATVLVLEGHPARVVSVPPELFERAGRLLIGRQPVTVRGRVDARDDVPHDVLATEVTAVPAGQGEGGGFPATDPEVQPPTVVGLSDRERRKLTDALYYWFDEKQVAARVEPVVAALVAQARTEGEKKERERLLEIARQDRRDSASYWAEQFAQAAELDDPGPRVTELARALRTQP